MVPRDDELAETLLDSSTDEWMIGEYFNRLHDELRRLNGRGGIDFHQEIGEPAEIVQRIGRVAQLRQDFALGFGALRPRTRARR